MKIISYNNLNSLKNARIEKAFYNKTISEIFESNISFSFRVFTDNGQYTKEFHELKKSEL